MGVGIFFCTWCIVEHVFCCAGHQLGLAGTMVCLPCSKRNASAAMVEPQSLSSDPKSLELAICLPPTSLLILISIHYLSLALFCFANY